MADNPFLRVIDETRDADASKRSAFDSSMFVGSKSNPDEAARAEDMASKTGIPADVVSRNMPKVNELVARRPTYSDVMKKSPALAEWISDPKNAAVAHDDIDILGNISAGSSRLTKKEDSFLKAGGRALFTGLNDLKATAYSLGLAYGKIDPEGASKAIAEARQKADKYRQMMPDYASDFYEMMQKEGGDVARSLSLFHGSFDKLKRGRIASYLVDYQMGKAMTAIDTLDMIIEAARRPLGLGYAGLENAPYSAPILAGSAAGALTGGPLGMGLGSFIGAVPVEIGSWINESLEKRGVDTKNPDAIMEAYRDPEMIREIKREAERKGVTTALVDSMFNMFAGGISAPAGSGMLRRVATKALDTATQMAGESVSEGAGQLAAAKGDSSKVDPTDVLMEGIVSLGHSAAEVAIGTAAKGKSVLRGRLSSDPIRAAEQVSSDTQKAVQAVTSAKQIKEIAADIAESKLAKRSPGKLAELIEVAIGKEEAKTVFFQTDEWDKFFDGGEKSPADMASDFVGDGGRSYYDAKSTGSQFEVPLARFLEKASTEQYMDGLLPIARLQQEGMTLQEASDFLKELPQTMDNIASEVVEPESDEKVARDQAVEEIVSDVSNQMREAGIKEEEIDAYARTWEAAMRRFGEMSGLDMKKEFAKYGLGIRRFDVMNPLKVEDVPALKNAYYARVAEAFKKEGLAVPDEKLTALLEKYGGDARYAVAAIVEGEAKADEYMAAGDIPASAPSRSDVRDFVAEEKDVRQIAARLRDEAWENWKLKEYYADENDIVNKVRKEGRIKLTKDLNSLGDLSHIPANIRDEIFSDDASASGYDEIAERLGMSGNDLISALSNYDYGARKKKGRDQKAPKRSAEDYMSEARQFIERSREEAGEARASGSVLQDYVHRVMRRIGYVPSAEEVGGVSLRQEALKGADAYTYAREEGIRKKAEKEFFQSRTPNERYQEIQLSYRELQSQAKAMGLPSSGLFNELSSLVGIASNDPRFWSKDEFEKIAPHIMIHQDLKDGAYDRIQSIMRDGLSRGMVDSLGSMSEGRWTWAGSLQGVPTYAFISGNIKYKTKSDPHLAEGNVPLFYFTPEKGEDIYQAIVRSAVPAEKQTVRQTETDAFKKWFGNSKVVDADGKPLVVYHGTSENGLKGDAFSKTMLGAVTKSKSAKAGFFFAEDRATALGYSKLANEKPVADLIAKSESAERDGKFELANKLMAQAEKLEKTARPKENVVEAFLSIQNPVELDADGQRFLDVENDIHEAIAMAKRDGHDGVVIRNLVDNADWGSNRATNHWIAFEPNQIKSSTRNIGTFNPDNPSILYQSPTFYSVVERTIEEKMPAKASAQQVMHALDITPSMRDAVVAGQPLFQEGNDPRARFMRTPSGKTFIDLFKTANVTSLMHESGHMWFEMLADFAENPESNQEIKTLYADTLKWLGVESRADVKTEHHERFARALEAYLMEGKAPSLGLRRVFQKFKDWFTRVYRDLSSLNVEMSDQVRDIFNRLLASEDEIAEAEKESAIEPLFSDPKSVGMTDEQAFAYSLAVDEARKAAEEELGAKLMKRHIQETKDYFAEEREKIRVEVEKEVNKRGEYLALSVLQRNALPGSKDKLETPPIKIEKQALIDQFGKEILDRLPKPHIYAKEGLTPDAAAQLFGFSSGDEMIRKFETMPSRERLIEQMTENLMDERHPDLLRDKQALKSEATAALHNEKRSDLLRKEIEYLASNDFAKFKGLVKSVSKSIPSDVAMRKSAEKIVEGKRIRDLKPYLFQRAESNAAKEAVDLLLKGDIDGAFIQKKKEMLNHYLYKAAVAASDASDKKVEYLKKFNEESKRKSLGFAGQSYLDQVDQVMERFDFRKSVSGAEADRRMRLSEWISEQEKMGLVPPVPDYVRDEAFKKPYKNMTVLEIEELHDFVKTVDHLARLKNRLLADQKGREIQAAVDELVASIEANSNGKKNIDIEPRLPGGDLRRLAVGFFGSHRKFSSLARQADGYKDNGAMVRNLVMPANSATDRQSSMRAAAAKSLERVFSKYSFKDIAGLSEKIFYPAIKKSLTKIGAMSVALNWGNMDNRQKLMAGYGWDEKQVKSILDSLTKKDWDTVQEIWDLIDSYWAETEALSRRVDGVAPKKVEPAEIDTPFGKYRGGYYPLKYDSFQEPRAYADEAKDRAERSMKGAYFRATTKHGMRMERVQNVKLPIRLDFGVFMEHINEVIHDQTHYEFLIDMNRIMGNRDFQKAAIEHHGPDFLAQLRDTITDMAVGDTVATDAFEKSINWIRSGSSIAAMGWNFMTGLQQPAGLTQSIVRLGPKYVAQGLARWLGSPARMNATYEWILGESEFMRNRSDNTMREVSEIRNQLRVKGKIMGPIEDSYFYIIGKMQSVVDIPTWIGAYEKAWATMSDEELQDMNEAKKTAVKLADQAVRDTQGTGNIVDLAKIQRGSPTKKLWTNFYSFFNTTYNLAAESVGATNFKDASSVAKMAADMLLLTTLPAVMGYAIRNAFRDRDRDDLLKELAKENALFAMNMIVGLRDIGAAVSGFSGYEGPAGARFFSEAGKLAKQAGQGEADGAFWKALTNTAGILFHFPATQIIRTARGIKAVLDGEAGPQAVLFGPEK